MKRAEFRLGSGTDIERSLRRRLWARSSHRGRLRSTSSIGPIADMRKVIETMGGGPSASLYAAVRAASIFAAHWAIVRLSARAGTGRLK